MWVGKTLSNSISKFDRPGAVCVGAFCCIQPSFSSGVFSSMGKSLTIFRAFGIPVRLHWTFIFVLFMGGLLANDLGGTLTDYIWSGALLLSMFTCVLLHEFGHALTARRFKITTRDILLSPIGGLARMNALPDKPLQEFWIALAGPLVNVAIVILIGVSMIGIDLEALLWRMENQVDDGILNAASFLPLLLVLNIMLVIFNLIPAFPMDGGRVLRALLSLKLPRLRATLIAARIGQVLGSGMIGYGIYAGAWTLAFIGVFVIVMAQREYKSLERWERLDTTSVGKLMQRVPVISVEDTLSEVLRQYGPLNFPVVNSDGDLVGWLSGSTVAQNSTISPEATVGGYLIPERPPQIAATKNLRAVIGEFQRAHLPLGFVTEQGAMVGIISERMVADFLDS